MSGSRIRLLIVDDHKMFLDGLVEILGNESNIEIVSCATSGEEALKKLAENTVDIMVTDLRMKDMDGKQLSEMVSEKFPIVKILMVSMHNEPLVVNDLLKSGIHGYILKNTGKEELLLAINKISLGQTFFSDEVMTKFMNSRISKKNINQNDITLTSREKDVLELIAAEYTTNEMAEKLFISLNTVETHRKNILRKLNVRNSVGIVRRAIDLGLL